jgi:hypothetical protein
MRRYTKHKIKSHLAMAAYQHRSKLQNMCFTIKTGNAIMLFQTTENMKTT